MGKKRATGTNSRRPFCSTGLRLKTLDDAERRRVVMQMAGKKAALFHEYVPGIAAADRDARANRGYPATGLRASKYARTATAMRAIQRLGGIERDAACGAKWRHGRNHEIMPWMREKMMRKFPVQTPCVNRPCSRGCPYLAQSLTSRQRGDHFQVLRQGQPAACAGACQICESATLRGDCLQRIGALAGGPHQAGRCVDAVDGATGKARVKRAAGVAIFDPLSLHIA